MSDPFVLALIERQEREKLSSTAFAIKLQVAASYWTRVRRGEREAGRLLIKQALGHYPELAPLLAPVVTESTIGGDDVQDLEAVAV